MLYVAPYTRLKLRFEQYVWSTNSLATWQLESPALFSRSNHLHYLFTTLLLRLTPWCYKHLSSILIYVALQWNPTTGSTGGTCLCVFVSVICPMCPCYIHPEGVNNTTLLGMPTILTHRGLHNTNQVTRHKCLDHYLCTESIMTFHSNTGSK